MILYLEADFTAVPIKVLWKTPLSMLRQIDLLVPSGIVLLYIVKNQKHAVNFFPLELYIYVCVTMCMCVYMRYIKHDYIFTICVHLKNNDINTQVSLSNGWVQMSLLPSFNLCHLLENTVGYHLNPDFREQRLPQ